MDFWTINLLNGLSLAMILFLLSAGLTLIFGLMHIVNLAHGAYYLLGGYVGVAIAARTGSFVLAALGAFLVLGALGYATQRAWLSRLHRQEMPQALLTLGILFVLADLDAYVWGGNPLVLDLPPALGGSLMGFPLYRLFLIAAGLVVAVLLYLFLERTRLGAIVRAGMDDQEMVRGLGIDMSLVFGLVFALGAGLAALGGVLAAPLLGLFPGADFEVALLAFTVVTVGGLGSIRGAFLASILVGLIDNFGNAWFPQLSLFTVFVPMLAVLALRPQGLLGRA